MLGLGVIALACAPLPGTRTRPGLYLGASFGAPLKDFFQRYAGVAGLILALICLYRVSDFVLNVMNPFYLDLGFSKIEIAEVRKVFGVVASMAGVFVGGWAVVKLGLMRALVIGAVAGPVSNLVFIALAMIGHSMPALYIAIGLDNIAAVSPKPALSPMSSLTSSGHSDAICAILIALCVAGQADRLAVGTHHRRRGKIRK